MFKKYMANSRKKNRKYTVMHRKTKCIQ